MRPAHRLMSARWNLVWGSIFCGLSVALGALAAHALADVLGDRGLAVYQTAVRYQTLHGLALLAIGVYRARYQSDGASAIGDRWLGIAGLLFVVGIVLFSGSLYVLALGGPRFFGPVTPVGGLLFLGGWALAASGFFRSTTASAG